MHVILESVMKRTVPDEDHKWMYMYLLIRSTFHLTYSLLLLYCAAILSVASVSFICHV